MIKPNCSPQMWYNLHFTLIIFYPDLYLHIISFLRDLRDTNNNSDNVVRLSLSALQYTPTIRQSYSNQKIICKILEADGVMVERLRPLLPGLDRIVCLHTPR